MNVKSRKDSKGYVLRTGECQRNDGRYSYSYTDRMGTRHSIYSKTLPELRAREKQLQREYEDGLDPHKAAKLTLNNLYDRYISQKYNLKPTTKGNPTAKKAGKIREESAPSAARPTQRP